jgi:formylglycine-generating enzyme required for sulfatase activity
MENFRVSLFISFFSALFVIFLSNCVQLDHENINDPENPDYVAYYTVGGKISGLEGTLVLQLNGADDLEISKDGKFVFKKELKDGSDYIVTVLSNPEFQTCLVTKGDAEINDKDVTDVIVNCSENTYSIGGTISGLEGSGLVLQNNGSDDLEITENESFSFSTELPNGMEYNVTVYKQPSQPNQICTVHNGFGQVSDSNISEISVTCLTEVYTIGGLVSGLFGSNLMLQNEGTESLSIFSDGIFTFSTPIPDFTEYNVTVFSEPSSPNQTCSVSNGSGTISGANVSNILIICSTINYKIGGTITGLSGDVLVLQNMGSDNLDIYTEGEFTFSTSVPDLSDYNVTVLTQPSIPNQTCTVSSGNGKVSGSDITDVLVECTTNTYTVSGNITGLCGSGLVLQNNSGNDLLVTYNGAFTFTAPIPDLEAYDVTVSAPPNYPDQDCSVTNGSGNISGGNVSSVTINCTYAGMISVPGKTSPFSIGWAGVTNAEPVHNVASISAFEMSKYEIKYGDWLAVKTWGESRGYVFKYLGTMGDGVGDTDQHPVTKMIWRDTIAWCNALSEWEGLTAVYYEKDAPHTSINVYRNSETGGDIFNADVEWSANGYRLPTNAEWEYAARYINGTSFTQGDWPSGATGPGQEDTYAWYIDNSGPSTHEVGTKSPNALGIYDMNGNVWEWVWDWYAVYVNGTPFTDADTRGPDSGTNRTVRGADWNGPLGLLQSSRRNNYNPWNFTANDLGFRIVRNP